MSFSFKTSFRAPQRTHQSSVYRRSSSSYNYFFPRNIGPKCTSPPFFSTHKPSPSSLSPFPSSFTSSSFLLPFYLMHLFILSLLPPLPILIITSFFFPSTVSLLFSGELQCFDVNLLSYQFILSVKQCLLVCSIIN